MSKKSMEIGVGKKVLASALSAAMVVAFAPAVAMAEEPGETPAQGSEASAIVSQDDEGQTSTEDAVAQIGETAYQSLTAALTAAKNGDTVVLLKNAVGDGLKLVASDNKNITIDLNNHTYTVSKLVGSGGSENQAVHFELGNTVCLKNGTLTVDESVSKSAKIIVQNYSRLTASNVLFDGSNLLIENQDPCTLSNNGNISTFENCIVKVPDRNDRDVVAVDLSVWGSYKDTDVTLDSCVVEGKLDISQWNYDSEKKTYVRADGVAKNDKGQPCLKVSGGTYTDIANAVMYSVDNNVLKMGANTTANLEIPAGKDITLDLNGKTLTVPNDCGIDVAGQLTVSDSAGSGMVECNKTPVCSDGTGAVFTLNSGEMKSATDYCIYCKEGGKAVINGGKVSSEYSVLSGNNTTGDMNFEINGGELTANKGPAIYMSGQVNLKMTGGTLNGGISLRMGQVDISGGTINATQSSIDMPTDIVDSDNTPGYAYSGNVWFPDALYVIGGTYTSENTQYGNSLNLNITGGTFNCANGQGSAVAIYDLGKVEQSVKVSISGSATKLTTNAADRSAYQVLSLKDIGVTSPAAGYGDHSGNTGSSITGGTFSANPVSYVDVSTQNVYKMLDGTYVVSATEPAHTGNGNAYSGPVDGVYTEYVYSAPVTPTPAPDPEPTPTPEPAAPGTNVSGTDAAGNAVEATVTDNEKTTLPDGTEAAGSVEYKGTASSGSEPASSAEIPASVTSSDGTVYAVTKIADDAFNGQGQLKSVSIPATVVEIGARAFAGTGIESVELPAATTVIGAGVFQGCDDLESVDISSAALTQIPADAFNGAAITSIDIPGSVKAVGARAFKGTALKSVSTQAETIAKSAFSGCESLKTASLPEATEVGAYALSGTALKSVSLPKAESIGAGAFKDAAKLKALATGSALEELGPKALSGTKVKTLTIRSKRLTKPGVKGSLKGSAVTKVEVAVTGSKKTQDKYVKRYSKFFAKANSGKSVEVTKAKKAAK